jgi:DNA helicase-2/ATP-dependent DNA helicase PcrA
MTRARKQLNILYSLTNDRGKETLKAGFLLDSKLQIKPIMIPDTIKHSAETAELAWYQPLVDPTTTSMRDLLLPSLSNYKLSITHLHNFLNVTKGGPSMFLLQNLLRFPQAKSLSAVFGTAIHDTLQNAHAYLVSTENHQASEDIISNFELNLNKQHIAKHDFDILLQKGSDVLRVFLESRYQGFSSSDQTELNFTNQHSIVGDAHLTGKLDVANINKSEKTITVTDYKTGKPTLTWTGKTDYEKMKLHRYKQQLMFYKLLVENARDFRGYKVEKGIMQFVEPTISGDIIAIDSDFDQKELEQFQQLIGAVWDHITKLDLPDISKYDQSYKGILAFEQDLIDKII